VQAEPLHLRVTLWLQVFHTAHLSCFVKLRLNQCVASFTQEDGTGARGASSSEPCCSSMLSCPGAPEEANETLRFERVLSFVNNAAPPSGLSWDFAEHVFSAAAAAVAAADSSAPPVGRNRRAAVDLGCPADGTFAHQGHEAA